MGEDRANEWHLARAGKPHGRISESELFRLAEHGKIQPDDLVWKPGFENWKVASSIPGLLGPPAIPEAKNNSLRPRRNLLWQIGLGAGVAAGAAAALVYWLLLAQTPSAEHKALLEALTRIREATSQGVNFASFSDLVLDASTKYKLAEPKLDKSSAILIATALANEEKVKQIWSTTIERAEHCPRFCKSALLPLMQELEIIKDESAYNVYFKLNGDDTYYRSFADNSPDRSRLLSDAMSTAGARLSLAISGLK